MAKTKELDYTEFLNRSGFNEEQSAQLHMAAEQKLSLEQMDYLANPDRPAEIMNQIRTGFLNNLTMEQVQFFAESDLDWLQMSAVRYGLQHNISMDYMEVVLDNRFDFWQIEEMIKGFLNGLTKEEVQCYANPDLLMMEMAQKREEILKSHSHMSLDEQIKQAADKIRKPEQLSISCKEELSL